MEKKHLNVVCGIITNKLHQILIALRDKERDHGGFWEFPGGKVELDESLQDGLYRELLEELNIEILEAVPWLQIHYEYSNYFVTLHAWKVLSYEGNPCGQEGQLIRWVNRDELKQFRFPEANKTIVEKLT